MAHNNVYNNILILLIYNNMKYNVNVYAIIYYNDLLMKYKYIV